MMMISEPRDRSNPTWENPSMSPKKLLFIHYEVWPEPSLPAQTSVFIAFTGDSPSGLEADQCKKIWVDKEPTFKKLSSKIVRESKIL